MPLSPAASATASILPACSPCSLPPAVAGSSLAVVHRVLAAPVALAPRAVIERPVNTTPEVELILAVFPAEPLAAEALDILKAREEDGAFRLINAAALAKDTEGRTAVKEDQDLDAGRGSLFGALVGGLIGLLGGPGGAVIGAVAGAATGGVLAAKTDLGFEDDFLDELKSALHPGKSALLLLLEERWADRAVSVLEAQSEKIFRQAVRKDVVERLASQQDG